MKAITKIIAATLAVMLLSLSSAYAQSGRLPIRNINELTAYAKARLGYALVGITGDGISQNSTNGAWTIVQFDTSNGVNDDDIIQKIQGAHPSAVVSDPYNIQGKVSMYDNRGRELFNIGGNANASYSEKDEYYSLSTDKLVPRLADIIPIRLASRKAKYALFQQRDKWGNNIGGLIQMSIIDGELQFITALVSSVDEYTGEPQDSNGKLSIFIEDSKGWHEETYFNGWLRQATPAVATFDFAFNVDNAGQNPAFIRGKTTEQRPEFLVTFEVTSTRNIPIYPAQGVINDEAGEELVASATSGAIFDGFGNHVTDFYVQDDGNPTFIRLAGPNKGDLPLKYVVAYGEWDDESFGEYYRERHEIPNGGGGYGYTTTVEKP